jgi:hypothetical protein
MPRQASLFRRQIRTAVQIHAHLVGAGRLGSLPILYDHDWQDLTKLVRRLELARERGWQTAADSLFADVDLSAATLGRRLERFRHELPKTPATMQVSGPRDIPRI